MANKNTHLGISFRPSGNKPWIPNLPSYSGRNPTARSPLNHDVDGPTYRLTNQYKANVNQNTFILKSYINRK